MYKLTVKITNKEGINETVINDFKTAEDAKKHADGLYDFAKEKVATGVLLSWYLIAEIKLITSGVQFALDIATKALDIAQSPNINNYYFIITITAFT